MAEDQTPPLPKGFTQVSTDDAAPPLPKGFTPVKKKTTESGGNNISQPLVGGGLLDPASLISGNNTAPIKYAPITDPQLRQQQSNQDYALREEARQKKEALSQQLSKIRSELPKEAQDKWDNVTNMIASRPVDRLSAPTKEELDHYNFMQTPIGKTLGAVAYLGSKATKGVLQVARGANHYGSYLIPTATGVANVLNGKSIDEGSAETFEKLNDKANFGLTQGDQSRMDDNPILSNMGGIAEFAPSMAAAAPTGGATFFLQGAGQAQEQIEKAEKESGVKVNPLVREAFIGGTGLVNKFLMHDLSNSVFSKLPAGLRGDITAKISADAIKDSGGKELTGDQFNNLLQTGAKNWADKVSRVGLKAVENTAHAGVNLSALRGASFALHAGVDATTGKPIFHDTPADLAQDISNIVVKQAPMFGAIGSVGELSKLTPYSNYKNSVMESLMKDPSEENVAKVKQDLVDFNHNQDPSRQWNRDEVDATVSQVDKIADVAKKLPRDIPPKKMADAVDLVNGREDLKNQLADLQKERSQLDESVNTEPNDGEQLLIDKVDQANDKLKDIINGKRTTYSIEKGEDGKEDKFFKKTDGKVEPITESRYNLENLERQSKTNEQPIESAPTENNVPETPQTNETGVPEASGEKPVEATENNVNKIEAPNETQLISTRQKAIELVNHGVLGVEHVGPGETAPRFDFGMDYRERQKAVNDISKGKYETVPAKKLLDKIEEFEKTGEYPIIEGKSGSTVRGKSVPASEMNQSLEDAKQYKLNQESTPQQIEDINKHAQELGITHEDIQAYEQFRNETEGNNGRAVESATEPLQRSENDQAASKSQNTSSETVQGKPDEPIGITKEETRKQREIRGLENLPDSEKTTLSKMFDEGKEAVEQGDIKPNQLAIEVADKPRNLSPKEVNALLYDRQNIREQSDNVRTQIEEALVKKDLTPESMQLLQDRQRFLDQALDNNEKALRAGANQNALALVAMQNMINADYTLSEQRSRMRAKAGGELTPAMEAELERYDKELKAAKEEMETYKQKLNDRLAAEEVKKVERAAKATKKAESKETIHSERKTIVDDFRAELKRMRTSGEFNDVVKATAQFLKAATPFMIRMVGNLAKEGIVEFKDVISRIHDEFKDEIENLTKDDVRDVLAGIYRERKETKNELLEQRNAILRISNLTKQIEDLENGIKKEKSERKLVNKRKEIVDLESKVKELNRKALVETAEERNKESLKRRLDKLNERLKNEDFEKTDGKPKVELDAEAITLGAKLRKAQNNFDAMASRLSAHAESKLDKTLTTFQQIRRLMLLSGVKTLGKLYAFAAGRMISTPIEEAITGINRRIPFLSRIAERSPRFSKGFDPKAEALAISTRWSKATLKDSWADVLKTGVGELDRMYGKHGVDKDFDLNPSALEFFGRLHGAFKNSTKRAEFFRSYQKRLEHAAKQGEDINDPNIQYSKALEAYGDGKRAILMNDNILVDKGYKSLLRGLESGDNNQAGKVFAAVIRGLFPIVKIPTNYVVESFDVATLGARAIPKIIQAMTQGAESLTPKEADMVMRTIAKGQIGLALMVYAYANPKLFGGYYSGKRDDKDLKAGDIVIGGHTLPHFMTHNPYFEAMQMAATMRRAIDTANGNGAPEGIMNQITTSKRDDLVAMAVAKSDKANPDTQMVEVQDGKQLYQVYLKGNKASSIAKEGGLKQGLNQSAKGLLEQIPFTSIGDIMSSTKSPSTEAGSVVKNLVEPRLVQEIAETTDRKDGEAVKRDPQGFVEQLKSGIPGLRQSVTEKEGKVDKKLTTIHLEASNGKPDRTFKLPPEAIAERQELNDKWLKANEERIRRILKARNLTEHDITKRLTDLANKHSMIPIYKKYKNQLKDSEE